MTPEHLMTNGNNPQNKTGSVRVLGSTKKRIAVVDDEVVITRMLQRFLNRRGHDVQVFASGVDFLAAWDPGNPPDLVILDICMPELDGFDVIDRLSEQDDELPPILLISGYDASNRLPGVLGRGRIAFLPKPFDLEDLSLLVDQDCQHI